MAGAAKCRPGALEMMSELFLGLTLDKSASIQCSDWDASNLSSVQIEYAATDVHAAIGLFKYFADELAPGKTPKHIIEKYLLEYVDKSYYYDETE